MQVVEEIRRFTISKEFSFCASHQLKLVPDGHPCARVHGHNYVVRAFFSCPVSGLERGMVIDYRELGPLKEFIDEKLDHQHLNDVLPGMEPTAENLAAYLLDWVSGRYGKRAVAVEVCETPKTTARVEVVG